MTTNTDPLVQIVTRRCQLNAEAGGYAFDEANVAAYIALAGSDTVKAAAAVGQIHEFEGGTNGDDCQWCHLLTDVFTSSL